MVRGVTGKELWSKGQGGNVTSQGQMFVGGSADFNEHSSRLQKHLTTIELGFAPFVPFTTAYKMAATKSSNIGDKSSVVQGKGKQVEGMKKVGNWKLLPQDVTQKLDNKWGAKLGGWEAAYWANEGKPGHYDKGEKAFSDATKKIPPNSAAAAAARMAQELTDIIEAPALNPSLGADAKGGVKGEMHEKIIATELLKSYYGKDWEKSFDFNMGRDGRAKPFQVNASMGALSSEGIDQVGDTDKAVKFLAHQQAMLNRTFDTQRFTTMMGIETTINESGKVFQAELRRHSDHSMKATNKNVALLKTEIKRVVGEIETLIGKGEMKSIYKTLNDMVTKEIKSKKAFDIPSFNKKTAKQRRGVSPTLKLSGETMAYTARQMVDRFSRIERASAEALLAEPQALQYDTFAFQMPMPPPDLQKIAYIIFKPKFGKFPTEDKQTPREITSISYKLFIQDVSKMLDNVQGWTSVEDIKKAMRLGAGSAASMLGMHANMLILDAANHLNLSVASVQSILDESSMMKFDDLALKGHGRGHLLNSIAATEFSMDMGKQIGDIPKVVGMNILTSKQIGRVVQRGIRAGLEGKHGDFVQVLEKFYGKANKLTDDWKGKLGTLGQKPFGSVFGSPALRMTGGGTDGSRVGVPMWMTMGRDPFAFKMFSMGGAASEYPVTKSRLIQKMVKGKRKAAWQHRPGETPPWMGDGTRKGINHYGYEQPGDIVEALKLTDLWKT